MLFVMLRGFIFHGNKSERVWNDWLIFSKKIMSIYAVTNIGGNFFADQFLV